MWSWKGCPNPPICIGLVWLNFQSSWSRKLMAREHYNWLDILGIFFILFFFSLPYCIVSKWNANETSFLDQSKFIIIIIMHLYTQMILQDVISSNLQHSLLFHSIWIIYVGSKLMLIMWDIAISRKATCIAFTSIYPRRLRTKLTSIWIKVNILFWDLFIYLFGLFYFSSLLSGLDDVILNPSPQESHIPMLGITLAFSLSPH